MSDKRTDAEKMKSPYFDHFEHEGGTLDRILGRATKKAIYKPVLEGHVVKAIEEHDADSLGHMAIAFGDGMQVYQEDSRKTVGWERWWLAYAEGKSGGVDELYARSTWAKRCIEIRAQALAMTPFSVWKGETQVEDSEFLTLLTEVNPESNWGDHIAATQSDLDIYGSAYWRKVRQGGGGTPKFLQRLPPADVEPVIEGAFITKFRYNADNGQVEYPRKDVVYFHLYNPKSMFLGLSPLEGCRRSIETEIAADDHMAAFFENHAMPQFIFSMDTQDQNEITRVSKIWQAMYGGKRNAFKTAFVGGGSEVKELGYAPDKLALTEVREEARKSICGTLGVPPVLVGAWEAANYATAQEQRQSLYTEGVMPRGEMLTSVINAELAPEFGVEKMQFDFDELSVMQEDANAKALRIVALKTADIIKPEVAAEEMGYEAKDVPKPKPVPDALKPFAGGDPAQDEEEGVDEAIAKWRKKALRRLRDGKSPAIAFAHPSIPERLSLSLLGALETATSPDDVNRAFAKARNWKTYP